LQEICALSASLTHICGKSCGGPWFAEIFTMRLHQLNPTASFIWDYCDGKSDIAEIIDRLAGAYEVDSSTARKDVEEVLSNLRNSNLLDGLEGTKGKF
jgi:Coenzyme PQQ synthesis protein D (PqqD)